MKMCRRCGARDDVRRGLCGECRGREVGSERETLPPEPLVEPLHDRPWVARSAFTRRIRRSPRS
jgi:hypothetical protein